MKAATEPSYGPSTLDREKQNQVVQESARSERSGRGKKRIAEAGGVERVRRTRESEECRKPRVSLYGDPENAA